MTKPVQSSNSIQPYDNGWGAGWDSGTIRWTGSDGRIGCRMCGRFEVMPVYEARSGKRSHFFGLHTSCARAYFARRKVDDFGKLIDDLFLLSVGGTKRGYRPFESE